MTADVPIKYMDRTRHYYRALGYTRDYIWASFDDVPFSQLAKPLSESRIALVTTASPLDFDGVKRVWSGHVSPPPPKLFTDNVAWDKESTHTNDRASFLPIEAAAELASEGLFGCLTARFHGVPTEYSQRKTLAEDAPEILSRVHEGSPRSGRHPSGASAHERQFFRMMQSPPAAFNPLHNFAAFSADAKGPTSAR
jgi:D-proline reductase (dithiol) PrdB